MKNIIIAGIISLGLTTSVMAMPTTDDGLQTTVSKCASSSKSSSFFGKKRSRG